MKFVKLFFLLCLFSSLGLAAWYVADNRGLIPTAQLAQLNKLTQIRDALNKIPRNLPTQLQPFSQSVQNQSKILSSRANDVAAQTTQVLGASIQVNDSANQPAVHQRAFEYVRYEYCQQVIKDYESKQRE